MKAYSNDLRRSVVAAYEQNDYSQLQIAELFGISPATVRNWVRRKRERASTDALPRAGGRTRHLDASACDRVRQLLVERNDLTLSELCQQLQPHCHQRVSVTTMCRLLQRLGLRRKKRRSTLVSATRRESSRRAPATGGP